MKGLPPQVQRAIEAAREEPKKAGALGLLTLVMLVLLVKTLVGGDGPKRAVAATAEEETQAAEDDSAFIGLLQVERGSSWAALDDWSRRDVPDPERNLFQVRTEFFPVDREEQRKQQAAKKDEIFWDKLGKSLALRADDRTKRDALVANYMKLAGQLRLQTIVGGDKPRALVNGTMVGVGDSVEGFRVLRIEARRIIVEREGIRLAIEMK